MSDDPLHLDKIPSIGISFQCALHGQRQLVLQTFIERDCPVGALEHVNSKIDIQPRVLIAKIRSLCAHMLADNNRRSANAAEPGAL